MGYDEAINFENLLYSGLKCMSGNRWKASVQTFELEFLRTISMLHKALVSGTYESKPTFNFPLCERGKWRLISAHFITDRAWQKSWSKFDLMPTVEGKILENNSASQRWKGTDHSVALFRQGLATAYRKWGNDFYVVTADYTNYFGSIPHDLVPKVIKFNDPRSASELVRYLEIFPGDFGIGIGGEPSQIIAIVYPSSIDRNLICNCPTLASGRYMDDSWAICHTKSEAQYTLGQFIERSKNLKLQLNLNRTRIHYMKTDSVVWLKKRTHLDPTTGKIVMQLTRKNVHQRIAAIKAQFRDIEAGNMPRSCAFNSIQCWCVYAKKYNSYAQMKNVVRLFSELFEVPNDIAKQLLHKHNKGWLSLCQDNHLF